MCLLRKPGNVKFAADERFGDQPLALGSHWRSIHLPRYNRSCRGTRLQKKHAARLASEHGSTDQGKRLQVSKTSSLFFGQGGFWAKQALQWPPSPADRFRRRWQGLQNRSFRCFRLLRRWLFLPSRHTRCLPSPILFTLFKVPAIQPISMTSLTPLQQHAIGHLCALARTTSSPASFMFLGADCCHYSGEFRPTPYLPLPKTITPNPFHTRGGGVHKRCNSSCPGSLFLEIHPKKSPTEPFYTLPTDAVQNGVALDWDYAVESMKKMAEFDAADDVFVILAHDEV